MKNLKYYNFTRRFHAWFGKCHGMLPFDTNDIKSMVRPIKTRRRRAAGLIVVGDSVHGESIIVGRVAAVNTVVKI